MLRETGCPRPSCQDTFRYGLRRGLDLDLPVDARGPLLRRHCSDPMGFNGDERVSGIQKKGCLNSSFFSERFSDVFGVPVWTVARGANVFKLPPWSARRCRLTRLSWRDAAVRNSKGQTGARGAEAPVTLMVVSLYSPPGNP